MLSRTTRPAFFMAPQELTANELLDILPVTYPLTHQLPEFPGVAQYPVDAWVALGSPMLTTTGWIKMCMCIAHKNMTELHTVFEAAKKLDPIAANDSRAPPPPPPLPGASSSTSGPEASLPPLPLGHVLRPCQVRHGH